MSVRLGVLVVVFAMAACGSTATSVTSVDVGTAGRPALVDAVDVAVVGDLDAEQREMIDWALSRFAMAGLRLPEAIEIVFDPTGAECEGRLGKCHVRNGSVRALVCEAEGDSIFRVVERRVTLLHELAHIWDWARSTTGSWPDSSFIVGGSHGDADVAWLDRSEERVALAITWGLLDQLRRPVRSPFGCAELYGQFVMLTGTTPLPPIEPVCVPAPGHPSAGQ